ncbi:MAG: roadblock/LC7 domain-containing protein [Candidatus Hodarchaeota archaeon]
MQKYDNVRKNEKIKLLNNILNVTGVTRVALINRNGSIINCSASSEIENENLWSLITNSFTTSEVIGVELFWGYLNQCLLEYETNKILMATIGDNILAVITEGNAAIGNVRYNMNKAIEALIKIL